MGAVVYRSQLKVALADQCRDRKTQSRRGGRTNRRRFEGLSILGLARRDWESPE